MPATRQRGSTREAILERAVDLASTEGLEGLTIGRLASELGLSKSGLFGHFGSKEELQLATVKQAGRRFVDQVVKPAYERPEGLERLEALIDTHLDRLERCLFPGGCFWAAVSSEFDDRPGPVRDAVLDATGAWIGELERQAAASGLDDPAQAAFELHSLALGANSAFRLFGDRDAFERARRAARRLLA